jgi:PAS domain S-box-containing protein
MGGPTLITKKDRICRLEDELREAHLTLRKLKGRERELLDIIESIPIATFAIDHRHRITHVNAAYETLTGAARKDLLGTARQWVPFYERRKKSAGRSCRRQRLEGPDRELLRKESRRITRRDDTMPWSSSPPSRDQGEVALLHGVPSEGPRRQDHGRGGDAPGPDLRREVEEALIISEEKSRIILDRIEDGYYEVDLAGRVIFFNDAFCRIIGYSKEQMVGMSYKRFAGARYTTKIFAMYNRVFRTGRPIKALEWAVVRKDGSERLVEFSVSLMRDASGRPTGFRGIVRDVTDARKQETELRRYKNRLEELVQERTSQLDRTNRRLTRVIDNLVKAEKDLVKQKNLSEGIIRSLPCIFYMIDKNGSFVKWNRHVEEIGGYSKDEMKEVHALDFFPEREKGNIARKIHEVFSKGRAFTNTVVAGRDGRETPHYFTGVRTHIGGKRYQVGVGIDTSDAVRAEKALRESEEKLSAILASVMDYMVIIDTTYAVVWANDRALSQFPNLMGGRCYQAIHGRTTHCAECIGEKCFRNGIAHEREGSIVIPSSGRKMDFWSTTSVVTRLEDGSPELILELIRDTTEKKAFEAEAVRVGQLASLGELAAGVAHEINNPINGILNYVQILLEKAGRESTDREILLRIFREGERVTGIVHNLLSFARVRKDEFVQTSPDEVIGACLGLVAKQLSSDGIRLKVDTDAGLPKIYCNSQQLQQVLLNVISNARYALNQKYRAGHRNKIIEIRAEKTRLNKRNALRIVVCDHGTGIPGEILDKIGSPFFTTKPVNEGTGLGLNISHGIVRNHGGRLWFDSMVGEYTKVVIDLPAGRQGGRHAGA